jgi:uncharacterized protein (TIGR02284 family)
MNRLMLACHEDIIVLRAAEKIVSDPARRVRLKQQLFRHSKFLSDLEVNIASLGGVAVSRASYAARFRASWRRIRGIFGHSRERNALAACLEAEARTEAAYAAALLIPLSLDARQGIKHHFDEISAYHDYLKCAEGYMGEPSVRSYG